MAPVAGTPVAPVTPVAAPPVGTAVYSRRVGVYPVAYRAIQIVWLIVGIIDAILALDFVFRALKANDVGFADFIYGLAGALAAPFDGIFGDTITRTSYVLRWGDLVAIAIYTLIALAVVKLIRIWSTPRTVPPAAPPPI
ncbi:MAG TPA: hypothetical protein VE219_04490 [Candidatus Sulfotelmatobacter sp.]|nr:hypothetical protein [Candidatus Sulfotelmatobacter sp.]